MNSDLTQRLEALDRAVGGEAGRWSGSFGLNGEYRIVVANTRELRERAWRLVYDAYLSKGYMRSDASGMRVLPQDALAETTTFLVERRAATGQASAEGWEGATVATLTVIADSPLGLPMDDLYRRELDELRSAGRNPWELAKFASVGGKNVENGHGAQILFHLFKLGYLTARRLGGATDFVATVNPGHEGYYRKIFLFERMGEVKPYDAVCGAPAVPLRLDLATAEERCCARWGESLYPFFINSDEPAILDWLREERIPLTNGCEKPG